MVLGLEMPHKPRLLRFFTAHQTDALKDGRRQHVSVLRERRYDARCPCGLEQVPGKSRGEADMDRALDRVLFDSALSSVSMSRSNTAPGAWPPTRVAIARSLLSGSGGAIASCSCERLNGDAPASAPGSPPAPRALGNPAVDLGLADTLDAQCFQSHSGLLQPADFSAQWPHYLLFPGRTVGRRLAFSQLRLEVLQRFPDPLVLGRSHHGAAFLQGLLCTRARKPSNAECSWRPSCDRHYPASAAAAPRSGKPFLAASALAQTAAPPRSVMLSQPGVHRIADLWPSANDTGMK